MNQSLFVIASFTMVNGMPDSNVIIAASVSPLKLWFGYVVWVKFASVDSIVFWKSATSALNKGYANHRSFPKCRDDGHLRIGALVPVEIQVEPSLSMILEASKEQKKNAV